MAITNNGVVNSLPADLLPSGYTRPTVTTFTDWEYKRELTLSVAKATVENATKATTMANIIGNASIGITKQIDDILAADFDATDTVTAYVDWYKLETNIPVNTSNDLLNDTAVSYVCSVRLYVKVA